MWFFSKSQYDHMVNRMWLAICQNWLLRRRQEYFSKNNLVAQGQWAMNELCATFYLFISHSYTWVSIFCVIYNSSCRKFSMWQLQRQPSEKLREYLMMLVSNEAWMIKWRSQLSIDYSIVAGNFKTTHSFLRITFHFLIFLPITRRRRLLFLTFPNRQMPFVLSIDLTI